MSGFYIMDLKGPILVVTALGLIASGAVFMQAKNEANSGPTMVQTVGGKRAGCAASGIDTSIGRLGCTTSSGGTSSWTRRTGAGGALFISSGE